MIRLKKLSITNWCQYRGTHTFDLHGNLVGIFGHNGAGKSNFIAALRYLLQGDSGNKGKGVDDITWGEESCELILTLDHDGTEVELCRRQPQRYAHLLYGSEKITGITRVQTRVRELLGVTNDEMLTPLLVKQGELTRVAFMDPAAREKRFHALCGIDRIDKARAAVYSEKSALPASVATAYSESELRSQIERHRKEVDGGVKALEDIISSMSSDEELERLKALVDNFSKHDDLQRRIMEKATSVDSLKSTLKDRVEECDKAQALLSTLEASVEESRESVEEAKSVVARAEEAETYDTLIKRNEKEYASVMASLSSLVEPTTRVTEQDLRDLVEEQVGLEVKRSALTAVKEAIEYHEGSPRCPTCDAEFKNPEERLKQVTSELSGVEDCLSDVSKQVEDLRAKIHDHRTKKAVYDETRRQLESRKAYLETHRKDIPEYVVDNEEEVEKAKKILQISLHLGESLRVKRRDVDFYEGRVELTSAAVAEEEAKLDVLRIQYDSLGQVADASEIIKARTRIEDHEKTVQDVNNRLYQLEVSKKILDDLNGRMDHVLSVKKDNEILDEYRCFISGVLDVLHREKLQRRIVQGKRMQLNTLLNKYLKLFVVPFSIEISEDMSMTAVFPGGVIQDAERLSGGEKVSLSVSMILAESQLFCSNVGLLILDEPTAFLDEDNKHNIKQLFNMLRAATSNSGTQVLLVTHEACLMDVVDQTVSIDSE